MTDFSSLRPAERKKKFRPPGKVELKMPQGSEQFYEAVKAMSLDNDDRAFVVTFRMAARAIVMIVLGIVSLITVGTAYGHHEDLVQMRTCIAGGKQWVESAFDDAMVCRNTTPPQSKPPLVRTNRNN